jgi:hypothetical protein
LGETFRPVASVITTQGQEGWNLNGDIENTMSLSLQHRDKKDGILTEILKYEVLVLTTQGQEGWNRNGFIEIRGPCPYNTGSKRMEP